MAKFDYVFINNGGDCEDLAHLEASLMLRALTDAGLNDVASTIELVTGFVGEGAQQVGHTIIQFSINNQVYTIDSTLSDGPLQTSIYNAVFGFEKILSYGLMASAETLRMARRVDTRGLSSYSGGIEKLEDDFLEEMSMTAYKKAATEFYNAVTDENDPDNAGFWGLEASDGAALAAEQLNTLTTPPYEVLDAQTTVFVGKDVKRFDTRDGLGGLMEVTYNRVQEMTDNLTSTKLNKYVGQLYNGYLYDYSRIGDF